MKLFLIKAYSRFIQLIVKLIYLLTNKGGGKFARIIPPGQEYILTNYCNQFKFAVNTSFFIETAVWLSGIYEVTTTRFLQQVIREEDIFLDIGANCGAITLVAASKIRKGKIYSFEPYTQVRERLENNLALNPQLNNIVTVVPLGISKEKKQLFYQGDPNYKGNGSLNIYEGIAIETTNLDNWFKQENINKVDVIKIDVEGMEYEVLLGSREVLSLYHPIIYLETLAPFFEGKSYSIADIYTFLQNLDYEIINPQPPYHKIPLEGPYPPNSVAIYIDKKERLNSTS